MKQRRSILHSCLFLFISCSCIGVLLVGAGGMGLMERVQRAFGPPKPDLDWVQRFYLSAQLLLQENDLTAPLPVGVDAGQAERPFLISNGESTFEITNRLESEGFIANAGALRDYLIYSGLDTSIQAGQYQLSPAMSAVEIARALQDATPNEVTLNILPGWRMEEIAATLPTSGLNISPELFLQAAATHPSNYDILSQYISQDLPPRATLEGFLFPDSYRLPRATTADELIAVLLHRFQANASGDSPASGDPQVTQDILQGFQNQGLSFYQGVTLASIIQREAVLDDEMPRIASVFHNRLAEGMKLDSDPTVQYALGFNSAQKTWWTNPLSVDDLNVNSPYNTYRLAGLPPGPIANPGLQALRAAAFPEQTSFLYFRAACDQSGRHIFSYTLNEHIQHACP